MDADAAETCDGADVLATVAVVEVEAAVRVAAAAAEAAGPFIGVLRTLAIALAATEATERRGELGTIKCENTK